VSELETVNKIASVQIINRFPKLSKQQKAILEWLAMDHGPFGIRFRTSKGIVYGLLAKKCGSEAYDPLDYYNWEKEQVEKGHDNPRLIREYHFIHAHDRLPHFLAQLRKEDPKELTVDDIYDFEDPRARLPGHCGYQTKKELLMEAKKLRASVCRSLKRLLERGLIVRLHVTKCYNIFGMRLASHEKTYYFLSKEQGQKIIESDPLCKYEGMWNYEATRR